MDLQGLRSGEGRGAGKLAFLEVLPYVSFTLPFECKV